MERYLFKTLARWVSARFPTTGMPVSISFCAASWSRMKRSHCVELHTTTLGWDMVNLSQSWPMEKSYNLKQNHEIGCLKTRILYHPYKEYPQTLGTLSSSQNRSRKSPWDFETYAWWGDFASLCCFYFSVVPATPGYPHIRKHQHVTQYQAWGLFNPNLDKSWMQKYHGDFWNRVKISGKNMEFSGC